MSRSADLAGWRSAGRNKGKSLWRKRRLLLRHLLYPLPSFRYESFLRGAGLRELYALADRVASLPGVIIECGSARCGSAILLAKHLEKQGRPRRLFALDSYAGFRGNELGRERAKGLASVPDDTFASTSFEYVVAKLRKLNLADTVHPIEGFFQDTLAPLIAETPQVAMVFIDCDLEESMRFCAETVWDRIPCGGIVAFDDYAEPTFPGSKLAIDAFVAERQGEIADHGFMKRLYYVEKR